MIVGEVNSQSEAVVPVQVRGSDGVVQDCHAVIDTGFNGSLGLPNELIARLRLGLIGSVRATLATGEGVDLCLYEGVVLWHGHLRAVDVLASDGGPLLGMALLEGSSLNVDVVAGGRVLIKPLAV